MRATNWKPSAMIAFGCALAATSVFAASEGVASSEGVSESGMTDTRTGDMRSPTLPVVGIYGGAATQNGGIYKTDPAFMVDVGFQPIAPLNLAVQGQYEPSSINTPGGKINFNTTNVLLKETVVIGGTIPVVKDMFIGTKTGATFYTGDIERKQHFAVGGTLGFDVPLTTAHQVSLGAEGTYLGVLGDDLATPDQTSVLGAVKYWF